MKNAKRVGSALKDTIRLPESAWDAIVEKSKKQGSPPAHSLPVRRTYERRRYDKTINCVLRMQEDPGPATVYLVRTRNLSEGGLGFFFERHLRPGTICHSAIMGRGSHRQMVSGTVRWCRQVTPGLHECGVQFDRPIELSGVFDTEATPKDRAGC